MVPENNTPAWSSAGPFVVSLHGAGTDVAGIGGKARSLNRLAQLGIPTPRAFAVTSALFDALRASGPPLPDRLKTVSDLAMLDQARQALGAAAFPAGFAESLQAALVDIEQASGQRETPGRFAVRSSAETEDRPGRLGAGIYESRVPATHVDVPAAIRDVLASFISPAAWAYRGALAGSSDTTANWPPGGAVLIHFFHPATAWGTAAAQGRSDAQALMAAARIETAGGVLTHRAHARIAEATRAAAARHGSVELEWVAQDDTVTFLQMRAHEPAPPEGAAAPGRQAGPHSQPAPAGAPAPTVARPEAPPGDGWVWDAAHNPGPLSPAQAGLVELVDDRCHTGIRQRVRGGYLFWRREEPVVQPGTGDAGAPGHSLPAAGGNDDAVVDPRAVFEHLRREVEAALGAGETQPSLESALAIYLRAYEPLFGAVAGACAAARAALQAFLVARAPRQLSLVPSLLSDVPSVATLRLAAAAALREASTTTGRQAALEHYLDQFGDESPRWDVAAPTLRETPHLLLLLAAAPHAAPAAPAARMDGGERPAAWKEAASHVRDQLPPRAHQQFDSALAAARAAVAVGEDDDALFARLQALVRRALLRVGGTLTVAGRLDAAEDVFFLPLGITRELAAATAPLTPRDLRQLCAAARDSFGRAAAAPPLAAGGTAAAVLRGKGGSGGRVIGRAVHHPAAAPLGRDAVLIAATLLPTELPLLAPGALVVETGTVLGHVAAQARERGIPAVVGAAGATVAIPAGALVLVDGDRGEVVLLDR